MIECRSVYYTVDRIDVYYTVDRIDLSICVRMSLENVRMRSGLRDHTGKGRGGERFGVGGGESTGKEGLTIM